MKAFRRSPFSPGDIIAIHQRGTAPSVKGSLVSVTPRFWVLNKHSIEVDGTYHESLYDRVMVPAENVAAVEGTER